MAAKTKAQLLEEIKSLGNENRRAESSLRRRTDDLLAIQKKLDAFSHTLANDIREPLGRVVSFAQMLEKDRSELSDEELEHYLHAIVQRGCEVVAAVDELLAVQAAPSTEIAEEIGPLDMGRVVAGVLERMAYMVREYQAKVIVPADWPVALGHGPWVEEVWANLISNAIRYGGQPPRVELGAESKDGSIRFWVRDNGQGLALEEQVRLFTRRDRNPATEYGLGLTLVQRIMEKLGGQVGVESEVGRGSLFYFTLPAPR
ncbi:MAG: HAMP domain-containing histidine kinase [Anaerolineae bacterium]|nr:HAMP domain-containing histidine kinase [Anaerolineae bacterium]